jgi:hypothetical protein
MLWNSAEARAFVAHARADAHDRNPPAENLFSQFVLDLAIDSLKLVGVIVDLRAQAPLAEIDDLPQLAALHVAQAGVGKADSRLHDFTAPLPGARVDRVDFPVWHARWIPAVPHLA